MVPGLLARVWTCLALALGALAFSAQAQTTSGDSANGTTLWNNAVGTCSGCHGGSPTAVYVATLNGANSGVIIKHAANQGMGAPTTLTDQQYADLGAYIATALPAFNPNLQPIAHNSPGTAFTLPNITIPSPWSQLTSIVLVSPPSKGGVTFSGTTATYTPTTGQSGIDTFTYVGSGSGRTTDVRTARVIIANPPAPVVAAGQSAPASRGVAFSFPVSATNSPTSWNATGLPVGLTINSSGVISGTPTGANALGAYPANVTATNAGGTSPGQTVTINLSAGPVPVINSGASITATRDQAITPYQITATNGPLTAFGVLPALPAGLTLSAAGVISGTPTVVQGATNYTLTASNAGETSAGFTLSITVLLPVPVVTSATTASAGVGNPFNYQITATNTPHTSYAVNGTLPAGLTLDATTGLISGTPTPGSPGTYNLTVSATNSTGTSATSPLTITVTLSAPVIAAPASVNGQTGVPLNYQIVAANTPTSYNATPLPPGLTVNTVTGLISGTPTAVGVFNTTMSASNGSGTGSNALQFTITLGAPVITSGASASGAAGLPFSYQVVAINSPTSYAATGLPAGLAINAATGLISGTPAANGVSNVNVTATNATGTGSLALTITIAVGIPVIDSPLTASGTTGAAFTYAITASNGPTSFGAAGLPAGLTIDSATGIISGTPLFNDTYNVTLTASNPSGTGSRALTIVVSQSAPVMTSASAVTATAGTPFSYQVLVANGPVFMTVTGLPPGLAFDPALQRISGTPTRGGVFVVTIASSNTVGTATSTVTITIGFQAATVQDLAVEVTYETAKEIALPINGEFTYVTIVTLPEHGLVSVHAGTATYTPAVGYSGTDSFTYTVTNPAGTSAIATVRISIGTLVPVASAAAMTVNLNSPATFDLAPSIRASGLTGVSIATQPAHGSVTVNGTKVTYTPRTDFFGADSFTYVAFGNAGKSSPATVSVAVVGRPDPSQARDVAGVLESQAQAARRFSNAQVGNFQRRMETLHRGRDVQPQAAPPAAAAPATAPAAAATPAPTARGAEEVPRAAVTGLMPVSLFAPLLNTAASRTLDMSGSTGNGARGAGFLAETNLWIAGTGQFGRRDAEGELSGMRFSTDGVSVGIDRRVTERLALGLGIGFGRDETDIGTHGSRGKVRGQSFALYGSFQPSIETFIDMLVGVGRLEFDSRRHVEAVDVFADGTRKGDQAFASLSAGAEFRREGAMFSPYGRIDVASDRLKSYTESGAGLYSLTYHEQRLRSSQLAMGVRAESVHDTDFGRVVPRLRIEYRRQLDGQRDGSVSYADLFNNGQTYSVGSAGTSRNSLLLGVGGDFMLRSGLKIGLDYAAQRASGASNVQSVRLLVSQDLDGRGLPGWSWQPNMFKDPIGVEFGYTFDDNVSRGRLDSEKLADRVFSMSVGEPMPFKLGNLSNLRLIVTPAVTGEKFQRHGGLGRFSAGAQAEVQYRASGAFDATTYSLVGRANYDWYESRNRSGPRYFAGVNARRSLTDRIDAFAEIGANARNGRSDVFTTRDYAAKLNLDYSLGKRGVLYLGAEYRRGDTVSSGAGSLVNVGLSEVFVPDDAFEGHDFFAYRLEARTVLGTIGWNYPLGPRDSLDFSWRRVQSTPTNRLSWDGAGALRYIDNQYSIVYLMRF